MVDLIVVGGGVAGLMGAALAASKGLSVVLLEKMNRPARKLCITGKGRCNLTNEREMEEFLAKIVQGSEFVREAITRFDNRATCRFFEEIGVPLVVERGGRVFPASGKAPEVADAMVRWARRAGVEMRCSTPVSRIERGFRVVTPGETLECRSVLITTGGVSYPLTGSTGDGYGFAYDFGHDIVEVRPSLVPLEIEGIRQFEGLKLRNTGLRLLVDSQVVEERFGDVEFTDRGLSGATVLQVSRTAVDALIDSRKVEVLLDLKPALSELKLRNRIGRELEQLGGVAFKVVLQKLVPSPLFGKIAAQCGVSLSRSVGGLSDGDWGRVVEALKSLRFEVLDYRPFSEAIITAGGVALDQVDSRTMESRLVEGLYFAGEVLDVDADTGGFNIQIALSTASLAADSIVQRLK